MVSVSTFGFILSKANIGILKELIDNDASLLRYMLDNTSPLERIPFKYTVNPNEIDINSILFSMYHHRPEMALLLEDHKDWLQRQIDDFKENFDKI